MIIVTGRVRARPDTLDQVLALALEHVRRSRAEPGCRHHAVHQVVDDPMTTFFYEEWADREALLAHFAVPESAAFVNDVTALAAEPPVLQMFEAEPLKL